MTEQTTLRVWNAAEDEVDKLRAENARLREVLQRFADNELSDANCASVEVAARRIRGMAKSALSSR